MVLSSCPESGFIHDVPDVCTGEANGPFCQPSQIDLVVKRHIANVYFENLDTPLERRSAHRDVPIKTPGSQQGRIQDIRAIGCRHNDDRIDLRETIHFAQDLVERLLPFVMPPQDPLRACRPTASISSMKMMAGPFSFAVWNRSRTRLAPTRRTFE